MNKSTKPSRLAQHTDTITHHFKSPKSKRLKRDASKKRRIILYPEEVKMNAIDAQLRRYNGYAPYE